MILPSFLLRLLASYLANQNFSEKKKKLNVDKIGLLGFFFSSFSLDPFLFLFSIQTTTILSLIQ